MSTRIIAATLLVIIILASPVSSFAQDDAGGQDSPAEVNDPIATGYFAELPLEDSGVSTLATAARSAFGGRLVGNRALFSAAGIEAIFENISAWRASTIPVCIFDPAPALGIAAADFATLKQRIRSVASEWNGIAGVPDFDFGPGSDIPRCAGSRFAVAVALSSGPSGSLVGVASRELAQAGVATMTLEAAPLRGTDNLLFRNIVLHEFGHALGLLHEIQHADGQCWMEFDEAKLFAFYREKYGVTNTAVIRSKLATFDRVTFDTAMTSLPIDPRSVMMYAFPAEVYKQPALPCWSPLNGDISQSDRQTLQLAYDRAGSGLMRLAALASDLPEDDRHVVDAYITLMGSADRVQGELFSALDGAPDDASPDALADTVFSTAHSERVQAIMAAED